jgi:hypothetical protein
MPDMGAGRILYDHIGRAADQADRCHARVFPDTFTVVAIAFKERFCFLSIKHPLFLLIHFPCD